MGSKRQYYLSEMAIADNGGGGLTLQRVLQDDLQAFDLFVHVSDYATQVAPIADRFASRQLNLNQLYPLPRISSIHWRLRRGKLGRALGRLHRKSIYYWSIDWWSRRVARHILRHVELTDCSWLIVPQDIHSVLVMNRVWRSNPVRYVTWMMDDHVLSWSNGWHYPVRRFEEEFRFHLRNAHKVIAISPSMQQFYMDRFGVDSDVVFGPADPVEGLGCQSLTPTGPVRLAYFGSIWPWQRDALVRLIRHLAPNDATLDVFGFHNLPSELQSPRVRVQPPVLAKDVLARMREYDGVVIPAGFGEDVRNMSELNISTKLSECLACGTVPVLIAPEFAAMVKFAKKHGGAVIISDFDSPEQVNVLRALKSAPFRSRVLKEARQVVATECSTDVMRDRWIRVWHDCAEETSCVEPASGNVPIRAV